MLGVGNCFHDCPCLLLALQLIATICGPILNCIPISSQLRIARLFSFEYIQEISLLQELGKIVSINISNKIRLRREIVPFRLLGQAGFEGAFNGIASKVVCPRELAVP